MEIEELLHTNQRSLKDYPPMPYPEDTNLTSCLDNSLILSKLDYNNDETRSEFVHFFASMTGNIPIHISSLKYTEYNHHLLLLINN